MTHNLYISVCKYSQISANSVQKRHIFLSDGQKRKLSIALALIGNSKIVLLDEPTSGLDVFSRRKLWDFLKGYKKDKIIILTTHSLEEAEYLGDRIGIMTNGSYICSGTSSFLKSKYPCGFNLNLLITSLITTSFIAAFTIGGKALGKQTAIKNSTKIVKTFAQTIHIFYKK